MERKKNFEGQWFWEKPIFVKLYKERIKLPCKEIGITEEESRFLATGIAVSISLTYEEKEKATR